MSSTGISVGKISPVVEIGKGWENEEHQKTWRKLNFCADPLNIYEKQRFGLTVLTTSMSKKCERQTKAECAASAESTAGEEFPERTQAAQDVSSIMLTIRDTHPRRLASQHSPENVTLRVSPNTTYVAYLRRSIMFCEERVPEILEQLHQMSEAEDGA